MTTLEIINVSVLVVVGFAGLCKLVNWLVWDVGYRSSFQQYDKK